MQGKIIREFSHTGDQIVVLLAGLGTNYYKAIVFYLNFKFLNSTTLYLVSFPNNTTD